MIDNQFITDQFTRHFDGAPERIVRAPGRVNLIGEHTDYNDGFVLPMAVNYDIRIATRARLDRIVRLYSVDFDLMDSFSLDDIIPARAGYGWSNYVRGVAVIMQRERSKLGGMDAVFAGDIPRAAGLSSSAALELASITAWRFQNALSIDPVSAALIGQRAENEFVGVRCGIMDQFISSLGQAGHALLIDCRSLDYKPVSLPPGVAVVVTASGIQRGLVDSAYNERRAQCEEAARLLGVAALRDVSVEMFNARQGHLPPVTLKRARHAVTEDQRTLDSVAALERGDIAAFGRLMNESHASMRDDFENSTPDMDVLVEIQQQTEGVYGARMTGGGFGGCSVALVQNDAVQSLEQAIRTQYPARTGRKPEVYICHASEGAGLA
ncbi:MAG: galactokinase [Anaerolineae bacterium]